MGLPTHRNETIRGILQRRWSKAHKNWAGGFPVKTEAQALTGGDAEYSTAINDGDMVTHDADGTVDRTLDALKADRAARAKGVTDSDSVGDGDGANDNSKGT